MSGRGATSVTRLPPPPQEISRPLRSAGGIFFFFFSRINHRSRPGAVSQTAPRCQSEDATGDRGGATPRDYGVIRSRGARAWAAPSRRRDIKR